MQEENEGMLMSNRINRVIELLAQKQPIYYTGAHSGQKFSYEKGSEDASTWADYINAGMEHGPLDMRGLEDYMHGMMDAGPINSGHLTPAVIVEAPVEGSSEDIIRYNAWHSSDRYWQEAYMGSSYVRQKLLMPSELSLNHAVTL